jgi:uncharacterized protein
MEFEWDEAKRLSNIRKHGIDFTEITSIFDGEIIINEDTSSFYGEPRYILLPFHRKNIDGMSGEKLTQSQK